MIVNNHQQGNCCTSINDTLIEKILSIHMKFFLTEHKITKRFSWTLKSDFLLFSNMSKPVYLLSAIFVLAFYMKLHVHLLQFDLRKTNVHAKDLYDWYQQPFSLEDRTVHLPREPVHQSPKHTHMHTCTHKHTDTSDN